MSDWGYAQQDPKEQLAQLHFFSINKIQDGEEIEMRITVKQFATPSVSSLAFFAQTDKQTNQHVAPYTPSGWGTTMLEALGACIREMRRFPYQPEAAEK